MITREPRRPDSTIKIGAETAQREAQAGDGGFALDLRAFLLRVTGRLDSPGENVVKAPHLSRAVAGETIWLDWMVNPFWLSLDDEQVLRLRGHEDLELTDASLKPLQVAPVLKAQQEKHWIVFRCHLRAEGMLFWESTTPCSREEVVLFRNPRPARSLIGDLIGAGSGQLNR